MNIKLTLNHHLQTKLYNNQWLNSCLQNNTTSFPYRPSTTNKPQIYDLNLLPNNAPTQNPIVTQTTKPMYVVNIPMAHYTNQESHAPVLRLINLLKDEAFGATPHQSQQEVIKRCAIVIGINQIASIDQEITRKFYHYIQTVPKIDGIVYRVFGFLWTPLWKVTSGHNLSLLAPINKAFLLLKVLSERCAHAVREEFEGNGNLNKDIVSKIPYQRLRERIKSHPFTKSFTDHFTNTARNSSVYYTVMDADCLKLRTNIGLFSRFDTHIQTYSPLSAISLGYRMSDNERPLIKLGVQIDMKVRQAMTTAVPYSGYLPEPASAFCIRHPNQPHQLDKLSFIGDGHTLENRRLIQNGRKNGLFNQRVLFVADGGIMIETPARMKTKINGTINNLTPKIIKQKKYLGTLRAISQSHIMPREWAIHVYCALNFSTSRMTDAISPMTFILDVFDPITRMYSELGRYSSSVFDRIINNYNRPLSDGQKNMLDTQKTKLLLLGMSLPMIESIILAAKRSGEAIYLELKRVTNL